MAAATNRTNSPSTACPTPIPTAPQPRVAFSPPQFAISEFKIQTATFDAALGHTMGSTVNVSIKSGTNKLHGEVHEWFRHSILDAPTIFQNRSGQKISIYQDNRYGASAGAPVFIPKVYNGKNKTFWFVAYEANKFGNPDSGGNITSTVPTAKMHAGRFLRIPGARRHLPDLRSAQHHSSARTDATCAPPIPNNIIPTSQLDKVGLNLINLYPLPNQAGTKDFQNNFYRSGKALEDYWALIGRVDHAFSENHRIFLRVHRDYWQEDKNRNFSNDVNGVILNRNNKGIALDDVYVFNPTFLLNFRYGLTFQDFPERASQPGLRPAPSSAFRQQLISAWSPSRTRPPFPTSPVCPSPRSPPGNRATASPPPPPTASSATSPSSHGNHTFRFGPEFRVYRESRNRYQSMLSPQLNYNATYVKANDTAANPTRGGEAASMLMGIPAGSMGISDSYVEAGQVFGALLRRRLEGHQAT